MPGSDSPRETLRQLLHLLCGAGAFVLWYWPRVAVVASLLVATTFLIVAERYLRKRRHVTIPMFRAEETGYANGAVRYAIGVGLAVLFFPQQYAFLGWLIFAAGDSASTLIGRRWPVYRLKNRRSLGGFLGFIFAAGAAALLGVLWWNQDISMVHVQTLAVVAALCASAELLITRFDDNYFLPPMAAGLCWLLSVM